MISVLPTRISARLAQNPRHPGNFTNIIPKQFYLCYFLGSCNRESAHRRRTNVQQLTCKIDLPISFYYLFFSFVLLELKPFVLKEKDSGEKL